MNEKIFNILKEYYTRNDLLKTSGISNKKTIQDAWFEISDDILKNIDINELYIESTINEVEVLKYTKNNHSELTKNVHLNDFYTEKICRNIKCLTFYSFYPALLVKLIDNNIININNMNYYYVFKYLYVNRKYFKNTDVYNIVKVFINAFYGILSSNKIKNINSDNFYHFDKYKSIMFDDIKNKLNKDLIYLDTDHFYYVDNNYLFEYDIPFEIENIKEFLIFGVKKYITVNENDIISYHGFRTI
jgi:hypothetical protein